jgi:hypothetical protein
MSGRLFALALFGVLISASNWVYAQETQDTQEAQDTEPAKPPDSTASGSQDEEDEEDEVIDVAADVFVPTEQISEDAAVPFPVDI